MKDIFFILPRKEFAIERARSFLKEKGYPQIPMPVKKHLKEYSTLYKYEDDEEEGFCVKEVTGEYKVYVNTNIMEGRNTWTYAHELAHIVLGHHDDFSYSSLDDETLELLDQEVDIFVSEYLMPQYAFEDYFFLNGKPIYFDSPHIGALKSFFNVSWEAMIFRLHNLGYQDKFISEYYISTYNERKQSFNGYTDFSYT
ncbi:ImmA/IrrE family metallo-endopeptidase [Alkaliphilus sp. B6464]|uniref:ImmA/IrrE family metallo-endopeptidase n=1 Tax=Alkaliphilus sp. B6464 TaxID=2731219 RepID=UPI001BAAFAA3|nr:ImmA/IrrE family metallo-endopeptidase [Alkaliphilus sp. B6464]QUH21266.1 ImmA/IrrE family metallo-endopeptidase [Alkaliphilus sp. B6464]